MENRRRDYTGVISGTRTSPLTDDTVPKSEPRPEPSKAKSVDVDKLTKKLAKKKWYKRRKLVLWSGLACLIIAIGVSGVMLYTHRSTDQLPSTIVKNAGFNLYFPGTLPAGFAYKKNSATDNNGVVFFVLQNGGTTVDVTEQAVPPNPPDLSQVKSFNSINVLAGKAYLGAPGGKPAAVIMTNTTLITIAGANRMPVDIIGRIAQSMRSVPQ